MARKTSKMTAKKRAAFAGLAKHMRDAIADGTTEGLCTAAAHTIETALAAGDEKSVQAALESWAVGESRALN